MPKQSEYDKNRFSIDRWNTKSNEAQILEKLDEIIDLLKTLQEETK